MKVIVGERIEEIKSLNEKNFRELVPFTDYCVGRVIEAKEGRFSHLCFIDSLSFAKEHFYSFLPQNEERFLFNLKEMNFRSCVRELLDFSFWISFGIKNWVQPIYLKGSYNEVMRMYGKFEEREPKDEIIASFLLYFSNRDYNCGQIVEFLLVSQSNKIIYQKR